MSRLNAKNAVIDILGRAVIPKGTTEIAPWTFDRNRYLRSISVPGTVKQIGNRAFADCVNLKTVHLEEGLETIGRNAFTGCSGLAELTLPDSIRQVDGWAFYHFTGLQKPACNRSKTVLYCYPCTAREKLFKIPDSIRRINPAAFIDNPYLEEVILPKGLETLESRTFLDCGIQRITIPETVKRIESGAFYGCKSLKDVYVLGENTKIEMGAFPQSAKDLRIHLPKELRFDEQLHLRGFTFLQQTRTEMPQQRYWQSDEFLQMAECCACGDADAMWSLASYLLSLGTLPFYAYAANFWRYRAYQKGHPAAEKWFLSWVEEHPGKVVTATMDETMSGYFDGNVLNGMGFLFFNPERGYSISRPDADSVVEVSSWCGDDGPDEDGFGREEYYDWWYLDAHLHPLPGVGYIHQFSHLDKRNNAVKFRTLHDAAAAAIRSRRQ